VAARWVVGSFLVAIGLGWFIFNRILVTQYPDDWGGPNFGAGGLLLLAVIAVVLGISLLVGSYRAAARLRAITFVMLGLLVAVLVAAYVVTWHDRTEPRSIEPRLSFTR
jgi:O-antigen ligase